MSREYDHGGRSHQGPAATPSHRYAASQDYAPARERTPAERAADLMRATHLALNAVQHSFDQLCA